jgi:flavin-dependent dehydrogenase
MSLSLASSYDAVIVGARCAGAATAMLLARHGLRVLAIDRGPYGADTLSTHALMRRGVLQLQRWGVLDDIKAAGAAPICQTTFYYGDEVLTMPVKARDGVDALYAPGRAMLDRLLVDHAAKSGARVVHETQLSRLRRAQNGRVTGVVIKDRTGIEHAIEAGVVIGADGLRSTVARLVATQPYMRGRNASAVVYGQWEGVPLEGYRWYYRPDASVGAIPTSHHETCIFVAVPSTRFLSAFRGDIASGHRRLLDEVAPDLAARVAVARRVGNLHGFAGHTGFLRQSWGPGWALVGDAGYFKDPLTAHGITDALRDAELLADALVQGSTRALAQYQHTRDRLSAGLLAITDRIASFDWSMTQLRTLHEALALEMSQEVRTMAARYWRASRERNSSTQCSTNTNCA